MASIKRLQAPGLHVKLANGRPLYSHVVTTEGGRLVFVAGQVARDIRGNVVGPGDMRAQLRQVCENVRMALAAAGARPADVVETTTYVTDMEAYFRHADVRVDFFGPEPPTSTTLEVRRLAEPELVVEIQAVALVAARRGPRSSARPRPRSRGRTRRP